MPEIQILEKPVEELNTIDRTFDLVYMDPPFGLQRDFTMQEEDGQEKVSLTIGPRSMITSTGMQKLSTMRSPN